MKDKAEIINHIFDNKLKQIAQPTPQLIDALERERNVILAGIMDIYREEYTEIKERLLEIINTGIISVNDNCVIARSLEKIMHISLGPNKKLNTKQILDILIQKFVPYLENFIPLENTIDKTEYNVIIKLFTPSRASILKMIEAVTKTTEKAIDSILINLETTIDHIIHNILQPYNDETASITYDDFCELSYQEEPMISIIPYFSFYRDVFGLEDEYYLNLNEVDEWIAQLLTSSYEAAEDYEGYQGYELSFFAIATILSLAIEL
jgi:hypothetical protein